MTHFFASLEIPKREINFGRWYKRICVLSVFDLWLKNERSIFPSLSRCDFPIVRPSLIA